MTWLWRISSRSTTVSILLFCLQALHGEALTGKVTLINSHESSVRKRHDFSGIVVWLTSHEYTYPVSLRHVQMLQKDKKFTPHVLAVRVGTTVDFPNRDFVFHNAFSNFNGQLFDIGLYPPGSSKSISFHTPGIVRVFCNIHPTMSAVIVVVPTPYFQITDNEGRFTFTDVPPGEYDLHVFHERATSETLNKLERVISVPSSVLPTIEISEAGYLPMLHKNKFGHEYPPGSGDSPNYSEPLP